MMNHSVSNTWMRTIVSASTVGFVATNVELSSLLDWLRDTFIEEGTNASCGEKKIQILMAVSNGYHCFHLFLPVCANSFGKSSMTVETEKIWLTTYDDDGALTVNLCSPSIVANGVAI